MSPPALTRVMQATGLSHPSRAAYHTLTTIAEPDGSLPGLTYDRLAQVHGCTPYAAGKAIRELKAKGWLHYTLTNHAGTGWHHVYRLVETPRPVGLWTTSRPPDRRPSVTAAQPTGPGRSSTAANRSSGRPITRTKGYRSSIHTGAAGGQPMDGDRFAEARIVADVFGLHRDEPVQLIAAALQRGWTVGDLLAEMTRDAPGPGPMPTGLVVDRLRKLGSPRRVDVPTATRPARQLAREHCGDRACDPATRMRVDRHGTLDRCRGCDSMPYVQVGRTSAGTVRDGQDGAAPLPVPAPLPLVTCADPPRTSTGGSPDGRTDRDDGPVTWRRHAAGRRTRRGWRR